MKIKQLNIWIYKLNQLKIGKTHLKHFPSTTFCMLHNDNRPITYEI